MSITFISITYNSPSTALAFVQNVLEMAENYSVDIVVVDNSDGDICPKLKAIADNNQYVYYLKSPENLGYFGGADFGYEWYRSHYREPDWVIVSNVDLTLPDTSLFDVLTNGDLNGAGVLAPNIKSSLSGKRLNPFFRQRPSAKRIHFYARLSRSWLFFTAYLIVGLLVKKISNISQWNEKRLNLETDIECPEIIYAPHGSMIIFSKQYFKAGFNFSYKPFLFGEEIFVAEAARSNKLPVLYVRNINVIHHEHVSTGMIKSKKMLEYYNKGITYCSETYFS